MVSGEGGGVRSEEIKQYMFHLLFPGELSLEREAALLCQQGIFPPASCVDIVVATPGRLAEHIKLRSFASLKFLR